MSNITTGHLKNNGGLRGHSAGDFFPFRVMAQGRFADGCGTDGMKWWVMDAQGKKVQWFRSSEWAHDAAHELFKQWDEGTPSVIVKYKDAVTRAYTQATAVSEAPDTADITTGEPMLYLWQVKQILNALDVDAYTALTTIMDAK